MTKITKTIEEILGHGSLCAYPISSKIEPCNCAISDIILAIKERDKEVLGEEEDIESVHNFFQPKEEKIRYLGSRVLVNKPQPAYDYAGGQVNGANQKRSEISKRQKETL